MNLNIIDYIVDEKKFTQAQIAEKMSAAGDVKGQVSQAQISRWKNPKNTIPKARERELIEMAGLSVSSDFLGGLQINDDMVDSKWSIISDGYNENTWFKLIKELVKENQIYDHNTGDLLEGDELVDWSKGILYMLNDAGLIDDGKIISLSGSSKVLDVSTQETSHDEADAVDVPDESIYNLKLGIEKLFSAMEPLCKHYWDLNNKLLKRGVGSQLYKLIPLSAFRLVCKEKFSPFLFRMDQTKLITMNAKTESKINETLSKIQSTAKKSNIVFDFEQTSQLFTLGLMREQDSAQNNNSTSYKSNPDSDDYYKYLSFGERKILEGIKRNETLLERLLEKLESDE